MHSLACFNYSIGLLYFFYYFFKCVFFVCCSIWVIYIILSFRSFILSSALFILLLFAFSSAFLSANEFYNFSWLLLIVSSSFLWYSTFIQFLIASVFSLSLQFIWRGLFHCLFFQGNSLDLLIGSGSSTAGLPWWLRG